MCEHCAVERAARERAERERERLMSLVKEWLDGNARLGRPMSIADQRFLNGLNAAVRLAAPPEPNPEVRVYGYSAAYRQAYECLARIPEQCLSTWESDARDALRALLAAGPDGKGKP